MLDTKGDNALALAVTMAFRVVVFFDGHPEYYLSIYPDRLMTQANKKTTIWEMNITKK
jgi:hypothetical protein